MARLELSEEDAPGIGIYIHRNVKTWRQVDCLNLSTTRKRWKIH